MKTSIKILQSFFLFSVFLIAPQLSKSQNWIVGTPVNMVVNQNLFHNNYCYPTADQHFIVDGSSIAGVDYYLYVNSAPPDSVYIFPGNDTLATGDSIFIPAGSNYFALYFFYNGGVLDMSIKAVGVPTTVGQPHPCQPSSLWMSNLMICDEELTPIINNNCSVVAGSILSMEVFGTNSGCFNPCTGAADASITGGTFPYSYLWSNGESTTAITDLCAGTYFVTVTDASSNTVASSVIISSPTAISIDDSISNASCSTCADGSAFVTISGGISPYTITWSTGSTTNSISNQLPGEYLVTITDSNNCSITDTLVISFGGGINSFNNQYLQLYPNPVDEMLHVFFGNLSVSTFEIKDLLGRKISVSNTNQNKSEINLDVNELPSGIYLISMRLNDGSIVLKQFVKE